MKIIELKETLTGFPWYSPGELNQILLTLHISPVVAGTYPDEPLKAYYRLFSRFINLSTTSPITAVRPTHEQIHQQMTEFLDSLSLPDEMDMKTVQQKESHGPAIYALSLLLAYIHTIGDSLDFYSELEFPLLDEITMKEFTALLRRWTEPEEKAYKAAWVINEKKDSSEWLGLAPYHVHLLELFFCASRVYLKKPVPKKEALSLKMILQDSKDLVSVLPAKDDETLIAFATSRPRGAALVAIYEILYLFFSLPKPDVFSQLPGAVQVALRQIGN